MEKPTEKLSFTREGESGMSVEIVGNASTLMSMLHAAIMSHRELRKIIIPVVMSVIKDDDFLDVAMGDIRDTLTDNDKEDIIDTE